jgi:DNA-binding winged helix-turn-helix (wHTH) protein
LDRDSDIAQKKGGIGEVSMRLRGALGALRSRNSYRLAFLLALFVICTVLYYFGELVDLAGWEALRWDFFYTVHDIHRLFFLLPIIYAGYYYGVIGAAIVAASSAAAFLPRALIISPFPDAVPRALLFAIVAGLLGILIAVIRSQSDRRTHLPAATSIENEGQAEITATGNGEAAPADLEIDLSKRVVKRGGQRVRLTPTEYRLLEYLSSQKGRIVTHPELLREVWGPEYGKESEYLRVYIGRLRHKIERDPSTPQYILTDPGNGYSFVEPDQHSH